MNDLEEPALHFDLLGPLRARRGGAVVELGSAQRQAVLATLLLHPNRPVSRDRMISLVWGDEPPAYAVNQLQKHVSALRRALRPDEILTWTERGYVLAVPPERLDVEAFSRAAQTGREARAAGDLAVAATAFRTALAAWRGPFCEGLAGQHLEAERHRLEEQRLAVAADRIEADLDMPGGVEVTGELRRLVAEHPANERLRGLLMLALYRGGQRSAAMHEFRQVTRLLRDEFGVEPTAALQRLHRRMLSADPSLEPQPRLALPAAVQPPALTLPAAPMQLPPRLREFVGRDAELGWLDGLLDDHPPAVTVAVISGTAGVGKTTLAIHWAHRIRDRFPDGQLYANLRGFDPDGARADAGEVIRGFLLALRVPAHAVPVRLAEQTALYRTLLAERRMLLVLDNAHSSEQVRPLLPGAPGCLVVVTSRMYLTGLVAAEGARPIMLDLPGYAAARALLSARIGADRVGTDAAAVTTLITACARLPLALAVVAARAVARPDVHLRTIAAEVRDATAGLEAFAGSEDRRTDVRAAFDWSYRQLSPPAARMFRLLGPHPGPLVSLAAAASLAGEPLAAARRILAELAGANLVTERAAGRFELHDLLRVYAVELNRELTAQPDHHDAVARMLDHYLHTAHRADVLLKPYRDDRVTPGPARGGVTVVELRSRDEAATWLAAERPVLLTLIRHVSGFDTTLVHLAWTIVSFLDYAGHWQDKVDVLSAALAAAGRRGDLSLEAETHRMLGSAYVRLGLFDRARAELDQALDGYTLLGDVGGEARVHRTAAWALERQQRHQEALDRARLALALHRRAGNRVGEGRALNAVGWFHARLGEHRRALARCRAALDQQRRLGDRFGEAETLDSLGYVHHRLSEFQAAVTHYRRAAELYRDFGDRYNEADTLLALGDSQHDAGQTSAARQAWQAALAILEALEHSDAESARARLGQQPWDPAMA
jgi:DNA-binding SARP family transcriptional activator/tetratricopeptide (TPR) repeat protein